MQRFMIFFITVYAVHVSVGFFAHHQELKNCTHSIWYVPGLLAATASVVQLELGLDFQLYMLRVVSPPIIRSSRTVHTASGMFQACLLLPLAWLIWSWRWISNSTTLAVSANKPGTYHTLCVQFLSS